MGHFRHATPPQSHAVLLSVCGLLSNQFFVMAATISNTATRLALNRSGVSTTGAEAPGIEYFWSVELSATNKSHTWSVKDADLDEDDHDYFNHNLFLKLAVLGKGVVPNQTNMVTLESEDSEGNKVKAPIVNMAKGEGPGMYNIDLSLNGRMGGTLTLEEGDGPVHISGMYLMEYPKNELLDGTQTESDESELGEEEENEEDAAEDGEETEETEETEEEEKEEKPAAKGKKAEKEEKKPDAKKRKASPAKPTKGKKSKKEEEAEEDEEEEEEDMEDDDEDDSDYEEEKTTKKGKKAAPPAKDVKKGKDTSAKKGKATPEVGSGKKAKKVK